MAGGGIEVACDESGSEGERLIGGNTDVFAHASVALTPGEADAWLAEVRRRAPTPASQYMANHILREKNHAALLWALGPDGPFHGRAHAYLADKSFLVVTRLLDLLHTETGQGTPPETRARTSPPEPTGDAPKCGIRGTAQEGTTCVTEEWARVLYREGPGAFGAARWEMFLASANDLLRTANGRVVRPLAAPFPQAVAALRATPDAESATGPEPVPGPEPVAGPVAGIVDDLARAAPRMDAARRARLGTGEIPVLDPMIPAIVAAVAYWSAYGPVSVVHDRHTSLTPERLAVIGTRTGGRLARLTFAVSGDDARIQLADVLAGVARKLASDELNGRADPELTPLIRPYIDKTSIWCDPFWNDNPTR